MLASQRHKIILNMLSIEPDIRTSVFANRLQVTDETIRRDLEFLDSEKKLIRTHGGAMRIEKHAHEVPLSKRLLLNGSEKSQIAQKALSIIKDGEVLLMDASSTSLALARILPDINLTVITNGYDLVAELMSKTNITTIMTGGKLDPVSRSFWGLIAWQTVKRFAVDKFFFSCNGLDFKRGASEAAELHSEFKENAKDFCSQNILLCDSTKLGICSTSFFAPIDSINTIITDNNVSAEILKKLKSTRIEIL